MAGTVTEPKLVTLNMRVKRGLLARIDSAAKMVGETRSKFLHDAAVRRAIEVLDQNPPNLAKVRP